MGENDPDAPHNPQRRDFLGRVTGLVAGAGVAAACWPFISSMNPSRDVRARGTTTVDLKGIGPGRMETIAWQGKPVFVLHRTDAQIAAMEHSLGGSDPVPDQQRVLEPEWLVVIGLCTHLGCVPNRNDKGWFCPCHGSVFDNSGRVLRGPAPRNLDLPPYRFENAATLVVGKST